MTSSHDFKKDKRNNLIKIYINGKFYERGKAKISVFDSANMLGDGCWDSLRYHNNKFVFLKNHIDRLYKDAKLLDIQIPLKRKRLIEILNKTVKLNKMTTNGHLRIIISRGIKSTPYQSPKVTITEPSITIIPEFKKPDIAAYKNGLRLLKERTVYVNCPYKEKWKDTQNTQEFSIGLMETIRSWSRHSFIAALEENNERKVNPVDILFDRLTNRINSDPENWSLDYVEHHLMMEKV